MARLELHLLGTGAGLSDPHRTTTMLAFALGGETIAVDCGGDLAQRLLAAGRPLDSLKALILTHEHADHVNGFPLLVERLWLSGRKQPLPIVGPPSAIDQAVRLWKSYDTSDWEGLFELDPRPVAMEGRPEIYRDAGWLIESMPVQHGRIPAIGLRVEAGGSSIAYSGDTGPCDAVAALAERADILVHEATGGDFSGHSSAVQAAEIARKAGARRLLLVHLPPSAYLTGEILDQARRIFPATERGEELGRYAC
ncbi:MAG: MBL fold metallo-hydrolase [Isosphaeraceae bacterium]